MKRLNKPSSEDAIKPVTWLGVPDKAIDKLGAFTSVNSLLPFRELDSLSW